MYGNNVYGGSILPWFRVNLLREALEKGEISQGLKKICQESIVSSTLSLAVATKEGQEYPDQQWENEDRFDQRMEEIAFDEEIIDLSTKILLLCKKKNI